MRTAIRRTMIVLALAAVAGGIWFLVQGGRYLQHEDPLRRADAVYVLSGSRLDRALEAFDLCREGYAPLVLLSPGRPEATEAMVRARGIRFPAESELIRDALVQLGLPASSVLIGDAAVDNTAAEGTLLRRTAGARGWRTVIVVTSKYHTRRTGFAMRRALEGSGIAVVVRATRYDESDPANWWRRRGDFRFATSEWQKLIAYRLGLGE